ncbi:MAG: alpha-L-fucosidase [Pseudomonadota bacterium]
MSRTEHWFEPARFGLFVHWGPWAQAGWEASWPLVGGVVGLPLGQDIPADVYHANAGTWQPDPAAPEEWIAAAAAAGMRYAVLTTRHHDGFALWPSSYGDYGVAKTAPGVDIVGSFVDACRRHGLKVGLYYSLPDWHHPAYPPFTDAMRPYVFGQYPAPTAKGLAEYQAYLRGQITELLTDYGMIDTIWFDGAWERSPEMWDVDGLERLIRQLQPDILINNRLPNHGDFDTPEQFVPPEPPPGPWETCLTMNKSWGFNAVDDHYKSPATLVHTLCEVAGKGGNLLLNIGPDGDGHIPQPQADRLAHFQRWMDRNGEAIIGTSAGLKPWQFHGPTTLKGQTLYCDLLMQPVAPVSVRGVPVHHLQRVQALGHSDALHYEIRIPVMDELMNVDGMGEVIIDVPEALRDPIATVLVLEFDCDPARFEPVAPDMENPA